MADLQLRHQQGKHDTLQAQCEHFAARHARSRVVLGTLLDAGVLDAGRIHRGWGSLCGVDRAGHPIDIDAPFPG